jgi:acyl-CoA synthetase (AMP-forming)/AMP-acid ligase II
MNASGAFKLAPLPLPVVELFHPMASPPPPAIDLNVSPYREFTPDRVPYSPAVVVLPPAAPLDAVAPAPPLIFDVLKRNCKELASKPLYSFYEDGVTVSRSITYEQLESRTRALATELLSRAASGGGAPLLKRGDRAMLVFLPGLDFILAFLACLRAGITPVPCYPPDPRNLRVNVALFATVCASCGARVALTHAAYTSLVSLASMKENALRWLGMGSGGTRAGAAAWPEHLAWWDVEEATAAGAKRPGEGSPPPALDAAASPADLAFLQYTSGSTSEPKGVRITHANLGHNLATIVSSLRAGRDTVVASWLPQYHDMGLIGSYLGVLACGGSGHYMSPLTFLKAPLAWLQLAARVGATHVQAPNFAYALAARRWRDAGAGEKQRLGATLSLSCLRHAFNAAETVTEGALADFLTAFVPLGLPPTALAPGYGLAESTVYVCDGGTRVVYCDRGTLEEGGRAVVLAECAIAALHLGEGRVAHDRAVAAAGEGRRVGSFVSCGPVLQPQGIESLPLGATGSGGGGGGGGGGGSARGEGAIAAAAGKNQDVWVAIVSPATCTPLREDGMVGEIWVRSPSVADGYEGRLDASKEAFQAHLVLPPASLLLLHPTPAVAPAASSAAAAAAAASEGKPPAPPPAAQSTPACNPADTAAAAAADPLLAPFSTPRSKADGEGGTEGEQEEGTGGVAANLYPYSSPRTTPTGAIFTPTPASGHHHLSPSSSASEIRALYSDLPSPPPPGQEEQPEAQAQAQERSPAPTPPPASGAPPQAPPLGALSWLRTGDMGFLWKGELYVCSRMKDLIIIRGRNLYPQDIEAAVEAGVSGSSSSSSSSGGAGGGAVGEGGALLLRPGATAVFTVPESDLQQPGASPGGQGGTGGSSSSSSSEAAVVVVAEVREGHEGTASLQAALGSIRSICARDFGVRPCAVLLLKARGTRKTTSGKVARSHNASAWRARQAGEAVSEKNPWGTGSAVVLLEWRRPAGEEEGGAAAAAAAAAALEAAGGEPSAAVALRDPLGTQQRQQHPHPHQHPSIGAYLRLEGEALERQLKLDIGGILGDSSGATLPTDTSLLEMGLDSLSLAQLPPRLNAEYGFHIGDPQVFSPAFTVDWLVRNAAALRVGPLELPRETNHAPGASAAAGGGGVGGGAAAGQGVSEPSTSATTTTTTTTTQAPRRPRVQAPPPSSFETNCPCFLLCYSK